MIQLPGPLPLAGLDEIYKKPHRVLRSGLLSGFALGKYRLSPVLLFLSKGLF